MIPTPSSRHSVVAHSTGGATISTVVREHTVATDQPAKLGGTDTAPTPLELLSVSLAACIALYVQRYLESRSLDAAEMAVDVKPFWREDRIGRFDVLLHLPGGLSAEQRAAVEEVARKCPVHHTLAHPPEITFQLPEPALAG
jgi:putative redox protein